jgi:hypothetical protein
MQGVASLGRQRSDNTFHMSARARAGSCLKSWGYTLMTPGLPSHTVSAVSVGKTCIVTCGARRTLPAWRPILLGASSYKQLRWRVANFCHWSRHVRHCTQQSKSCYHITSVPPCISNSKFASCRHCNAGAGGAAARAGHARWTARPRDVLDTSPTWQARHCCNQQTCVSKETNCCACIISHKYAIYAGS